MATAPPIKTTIEDIDALAHYLRGQVGWVSIEDMKKVLPSPRADNRKIEAMKFVGLLDRDAGNVKLSAPGREYAGADEARRRAILAERIREISLYLRTLEWIHHGKKESVNKTDVANYWHDSHEDLIGGATGAALTDAAVFFMRVAGAAGLGKFVPAGVGRDTHFETDTSALGDFMSTTPPAPAPAVDSAPLSQPPSTMPPATPTATVGAGLHVNVEIHIAADAKPATIEEIFKNMRKYLIEQQPEATDGS
jgi:hypothetical protein